MTPTNRSYIELHFAVLLFGFTAILGEVISLHPILLTWWRVVLASAFFLFFPRIYRHLKSISKRHVRIFVGIGFLVALHWLTFYWSIKTSNASTTLVCLATTTFFTAFIEPAIMKQQVSRLQVGLGLLIIPGMVLIVNSTSDAYNIGIILGICSALLAATFGTLNKRWLGDHDTVTVTWIEMVAASVLLTFFLPFVVSADTIDELWPSLKDWIYLVVLALLCTNVAYLLALRALRHLSAYTTALTINLEPVYGIILAAILLNQHEELNLKFYLGASIILFAVGLYSYLQKRIKHK